MPIELNDYDKKYDATIKKIILYSNLKDAPKCAEATRRQPRNESKSSLAKDEGYKSFFVKIKNLVDGFEAISIETETGGFDGGNCYGDKSTSYTTENKIQELRQLDSILEIVCPKITFLEYKELVSKVVSSDSYTLYECYGNSSNYSVEYLMLSDLYLFLLSKGFISSE